MLRYNVRLFLPDRQREFIAFRFEKAVIYRIRIRTTQQFYFCNIVSRSHPGIGWMELVIKTFLLKIVKNDINPFSNYQVVVQPVLLQ